ncbi:PREDICTED: chorion class B protein PC10-like [Papilio xuthus]|uniref:Chorion class B protein PC10-like n=1 Tax=Papilio xuthus TaxID=66420 RepID=A0AAJ6ZMB8_PAPXU|nr:PREDICTED: chorion class B protein PC10-like [Papilio xuthus]
MAIKGLPLVILQVVLIIEAISAIPCSPCPDLLIAEEVPSSYGGDFIVTTGSPIPPTGLSVLSENRFEGTLAVEGILPFVGTVGLEGELPTAGRGTVAYGCGNGNVGIVEEVATIGNARRVGARGCGCRI